MNNDIKTCCVEKFNMFHSCNECGTAGYDFYLSCGHFVTRYYDIDEETYARDVMGQYCSTCGKLIVGVRANV